MRDPDKEAIDFAREHLDLTRNLNDQGYYGPLPNEADPRAYKPKHTLDDGEEEYYEWIDNWIKSNGIIDNKKMGKEREKYLVEKFNSDPKNKGEYLTFWI